MGSQLNAYPTATDYSDSINQRVLENAINILVNSASAASLNDYDNMFLDIFSDADGYDGTIDTGNTTATFDTDHYKNLTTLDLAIRDGGSTEATSSARGYNFTTQQAGVMITSVEVDPNFNGDRCQVIRVSDSAVMETSTSLSSNVFTFTGTELADATAYKVVADNSGASYNAQYVNTPGSYPYTDANISVTSGTYDSAGSTWNIRNIFSSVASDVLIQTNATTTTTGATYHQLYAHYSGSGTVTYDISFDNGVTWDTGQPINTKNQVTDASVGTQMLVKINTTNGTILIDDYAVLLYY